MRGMRLFLLRTSVVLLAGLPAAAGEPQAGQASGEYRKTDPVKVCIPGVWNRSRRPMSEEFVRQRLLDRLKSKTIIPEKIGGDTRNPDLEQARDAGCAYVLKIEISDVNQVAPTSGISVTGAGIPQIDTERPSTREQHWRARAGIRLAKMGSARPQLDTIVLGEGDQSSAAAEDAMDQAARRVAGELKAH
jgi:hypothetical protein